MASKASGKSTTTPTKSVKELPASKRTSDKPGQTGVRNKMTPASIQYMLDMTVAGYTNDEIRATLKEQFGITISEVMLYYHRNKNADKLAQSYQQELETARARSNLTCLSRRIAVADELIKKEVKKKKPSLYGVATLLSAADTAIHRAEQRKMKFEEMAKRYREGGDDDKAEIMAALERRTQLLLEVERIERDMLDIVDAEFEIQPPRQLESLKNKPKLAPPVEAEAELEEPGEVIDENELIVSK